MLCRLNRFTKGFKMNVNLIYKKHVNYKIRKFLDGMFRKIAIISIPFVWVLNIKRIERPFAIFGCFLWTCALGVYTYFHLIENLTIKPSTPQGLKEFLSIIPSGAYSTMGLFLVAPFAFLLWKYRNEDRAADLEYIRKKQKMELEIGIMNRVTEDEESRATILTSLVGFEQGAEPNILFALNKIIDRSWKKIDPTFNPYSPSEEQKTLSGIFFGFVDCLSAYDLSVADEDVVHEALLENYMVDVSIVSSNSFPEAIDYPKLIFLEAKKLFTTDEMSEEISEILEKIERNRNYIQV